MRELLEPIQELLFRGGPAMEAIFWTTLLLWMLIFERLYFLRWGFPRWLDELPPICAPASPPGEKLQAWRFQRLLEARSSQAASKLRSGIPATRALVTILPLLGLLGTVLGMMEVFHVMAQLEGATPRALASGISQATLSTLGGLLSAIAAMPAVQHLETLARSTRQEFARSLPAFPDAPEEVCLAP